MRHQARWQGRLFVLLFLLVMGLLAWLSTRYSAQADWTANGRNTLSAASVALLRDLSGPLRITAYASDNKLLRKRIVELVGRYQRYHKDLLLSFVNPDTAPAQLRAHGITRDGELLINYAGREEKLLRLTERGLSNVLQRLARGDQRRIAFLSGHGERALHGQAAYDLGNWARQLAQKGFALTTLNLAGSPEIPADIALVVIAGPRVALLPGEIDLLKRYIHTGGNLLWLHDPGSLHGLQPLAEQLGLIFPAGIIVDPNVSRVGKRLFGTSDPRVALVAAYGDHPITAGFALNTLFPVAGGVAMRPQAAWTGTAILKTLSNTWLETGAITGKVQYDAGEDVSGPVTLGLALSARRPVTPTGVATKSGRGETSAADLPEAGQRVVVIADGDFLANAFLGAGGNLQLAMNIINWLNRDEALISIPVRTTGDATLQLSKTAVAIIGFGFLLVLPLVLLSTGVLIWHRRRRR